VIELDIPAAFGPDGQRHLVGPQRQETGPHHHPRAIDRVIPRIHPVLGRPDPLCEIIARIRQRPELNRVPRRIERGLRDHLERAMGRVQQHQLGSKPGLNAFIRVHDQRGDRIRPLEVAQPVEERPPARRQSRALSHRIARIVLQERIGHHQTAPAALDHVQPVIGPLDHAHHCLAAGRRPIRVRDGRPIGSGIFEPGFGQAERRSGGAGQRCSVLKPLVLQRFGSGCRHAQDQRIAFDQRRPCRRLRDRRRDRHRQCR